MAFYTTDMSEWTMESVVFIAQDVFGSKVQSDPVDFIVIPTVFSVNAQTRPLLDLVIMEYYSTELAFQVGLSLPTLIPIPLIRRLSEMTAHGNFSYHPIG